MLDLRKRILYQEKDNENKSPYSEVGTLRTALGVIFSMYLKDKKKFKDFGMDFLTSSMESFFPNNTSVSKQVGKLEYKFDSSQIPGIEEFLLGVAKLLKATYKNLTLPEKSMSEYIFRKLGHGKVWKSIKDMVIDKLKVILNNNDFPIIFDLNKLIGQKEVTDEDKNHLENAFTSIMRDTSDADLTKSLGKITLEILNEFIASGEEETPPFFVGFMDNLKIKQKIFSKNHFLLNEVIKKIGIEIQSVTKEINSFNFDDSHLEKDFIIKNPRVIQPEFYKLVKESFFPIHEDEEDPEESYFLFTLKNNIESQTLEDYDSIAFESSERAFEQIPNMPKSNKKFSFVYTVVPASQKKDFEESLNNTLQNS